MVLSAFSCHLEPGKFAYKVHLLQYCLFRFPDLLNVEFDSDYCYCDFGYILGNNSRFLVLLWKDTCMLHFVSDKCIL